LRSRALEPHLAEVSERLRALDGARSLRNDQRANLVGFLGASHVAALMRQTGGPIK
jgi:hypothetical protein